MTNSAADEVIRLAKEIIEIGDQIKQIDVSKLDQSPEDEEKFKKILKRYEDTIKDKNMELFTIRKKWLESWGMSPSSFTFEQEDEELK